MTKQQPKHIGDCLAYSSTAEGHVALSIVGEGMFNSYPENVRARVRVGIAADRNPADSNTLHAAFAKSPQDYLEALDKMLCARAEAVLEHDARQARPRQDKTREPER